MRHASYIASGLADRILGGVSSAYACRDFPAEVISLVNVRLRLTDADFKHEHHLSALKVSQIFGIREDDVAEFFPASALQGPFGALLRSHPCKGLDFILDLLNHAGEWYGTRRWPGGSLEPAWQITLDIPDSEPVQQWMNGRLYGMYRGMAAGPDVLKSALMALEAWLLGTAEMEGVNLETWLLHILRTSNNVMATAVVASICIAYPDKAGRAGLALLTSRELIDCDRSRIVSESTAGLEVFSGMNPLHLIYEQERKQSNSRKHRRKDLESLAVRMQLTDLREDVWQIIDRHRSELLDDQDEGTLAWRLALHRMDVRGYRPVDAPESTSEESSEDVGNRIYLGPGEIEPDVQRMADENSKSLAITSRHLDLANRARKAWQDRSSQESAEWKALLGEAQAIERELGEPEDYCRGGPGIVAAVCVRDHVDELNDEELNWCAQRIEFEVRLNAADPDHTTRIGRGAILWPDRACASVVPLLAIHKHCDALALLALALTHPVDEVAVYAHGGVGAFLKDPHRELVLQCAAAAAYRGRLIAAVRDEEAALPHYKQARGMNLIDSVIPAVRKAIEDAVLDIPNELASLDFDDWTSASAIHMILRIFEHHPDWEEARQFFSRVIKWLAIVWDRDRQHSHDEGMRNYELEHEALSAVAKFLLKLPIEEALQICQPLIDGVDVNAQKAADFIQDLIVAADGGTNDCFWDLWQAIVDKAVNAPWIDQLDSDRPYEKSFINRAFLATYWKDDVKHWARLDGHAHRLDTLARRLPPATTCLEAYSKFLYTIGQKSLPDAFKVVATLFEQGDAVRMASSSEIAFHLESLLRRFVYSEPHRLKSDTTLRDAILVILDALISAGSSSAYHMRDDFVTPLG